MNPSFEATVTVVFFLVMMIMSDTLLALRRKALKFLGLSHLKAFGKHHNLTIFSKPRVLCYINIELLLSVASNRCD